MTEPNAPSIAWLDEPELFPDTRYALQYPNGLLAASHEVTSHWLKESYSRGIFPWYSEGEPVLWWSPSPRAVLYLENFKLSKSLRKTIRKQSSDPERKITLNHDFEGVMRACAAPRPDQPGTWINEAMISAYRSLHRQGFAHSIEHWHKGKLVGGLYCVAIGHMIFGESMFSRETDASKVPFTVFCYWLKAQNVHIIDCQQSTRHLMSFGATELKRNQFEDTLNREIQFPNLDWTPRELFWNDD